MLDECVWTIHGDDSRKILGFALFIAGFCSAALNGWILVAFLKSPLLNERSMLTLLNLCVACLAKSLLGGFVFAGLSAFSSRWLFGDMNCKLFGFLSHFIGVYQIEALTHMSIERYVMAKYYKQGWVVTDNHYVLFTGLCWLFSILYSLPVLLGIGSYDWDYSCTACTFSIVLPKNTYQRVFTVMIFVLISVKPIVVMTAMLLWTRKIEDKYCNQNGHAEQMEFTESVKLLTYVTLACWTPAAVAGAYAVLSQLILDILLQPPLVIVFLASFGNEVSPAAAVLVVFWTNVTVRKAMLFTLDQSQHTKDS